MIGGSIAKTLKKINPDFIVYANDINLKILKKVKKDKVIDDFFIEPEEKFFKVDLIIFSTPISTVPELLIKFKKFIPRNTIITDVLSTKSNITKLFNKHKLRFVGSHPMAGSEKSTYLNSTDNLFQKNICVVCKTENTKIRDIKFIEKFWKSLGMSTVVTTPEKHDEIVAVTSHFIHILSFSFMMYLDKKKIDYKTFVGPSFKDFTRISGSNPKIWSNILFDNKNKINKVYKDFVKFLDRFMNIITRYDVSYIEKTLKNIKGKGRE